jgi:hypothetical protein
MWLLPAEALTLPWEADIVTADYKGATPVSCIAVIASYSITSSAIAMHAWRKPTRTGLTKVTLSNGHAEQRDDVRSPGQCRHPAAGPPPTDIEPDRCVSRFLVISHSLLCRNLL